MPHRQALVQQLDAAGRPVPGPARHPGDQQILLRLAVHVHAFCSGVHCTPILQHQVSWVHPSLLHRLISERMRDSFVQLADVPLDLSGTQVTRDLGLSGTSDPLDLKGDEHVLPTASRYPVHPMPASSAWMILAKLPPED